VGGAGASVLVVIDLSEPDRRKAVRGARRGSGGWGWYRSPAFVFAGHYAPHCGVHARGSRALSPGGMRAVGSGYALAPSRSGPRVPRRMPLPLGFRCSGGGLMWLSEVLPARSCVCLGRWLRRGVMGGGGRCSWAWARAQAMGCGIDVDAAAGSDTSEVRRASRPRAWRHDGDGAP
jgi:hypothetical protein